MAETETQKYRGNCHCAAFVFEFNSPKITTGYQCNCSNCYKKGATWTFPPEGADFKLVKGDEKDLHTYVFGNKKIKHKTCPTCSTIVYGIDESKPPGQMDRAINTRAIQDLVIWDLIIHNFDGARLDPKYEVPEYKGEEPKPEVDVPNAKTYHGSCHCGAVTFALKSSPLDETYKAPIYDCNCSIDQRSGAIWTYPHKSQVSYVGWDSLKPYVFGPGNWGFYFCKTCGVPVVRKAQLRTEEELAAMEPGRRKFLEDKKDMTPINLRALNGFSIPDSGLNITKGDGWSTMKPYYVNP